MRTRDDFDEYIETELVPLVAGEREKLEELRAMQAAVCLPSTHKLAIMAGGLVLSFVLGTPLPLIAGVMAPFAIDLHRKAKVKGPELLDVREDLIRRVVEFWGSEFEYHPWRGADEQELKACRLIPESYDRMHSCDTVAGKYHSTAFRFCELRLVETKKDAPDEVVWSGLYIVADFNKSFEGRMFVLPDRTERLLGSLFGRALQSLPFRKEGKLIHLESPRFERHFKVYAENDHEARYVLSPSLMKRIVDFKESMDVDIRMAFIDDRVHVALPVAADFFRATSVDQVTPELMRSWADEIHYVTSILDELDLNTRIWSKQPGEAG